MDLAYPFSHILKGLAAGQIEHDHRSQRPIVVGFGDSSESFLAGGVPDLASDVDIVDFDDFGWKFDANSRFLIEKEGMVDELRDEVGFADAWVAQNDYFEEKVILFEHSLILSSIKGSGEVSTEIIVGGGWQL